MEGNGSGQMAGTKTAGQLEHERNLARHRERLAQKAANIAEAQRKVDERDRLRIEAQQRVQLDKDARAAAEAQRKTEVQNRLIIAAQSAAVAKAIRLSRKRAAAAAETDEAIQQAHAAGLGYRHLPPRIIETAVISVARHIGNVSEGKVDYHYARKIAHQCLEDSLPKSDNSAVWFQSASRAARTWLKAEGYKLVNPARR